MFRAIKKIYLEISQLPLKLFLSLKVLMEDLYSCYKRVLFTLNNLATVNLELALYHLHNNNLNDAVLRLYLIYRFFSINNSTAYYWQAWAYYLKNNQKKALECLEKAKINLVDKNQSLSYKIDKMQELLKNSITEVQEIPSITWQEYRNIIADYYEKIFLGTNPSLYDVFFSYLLPIIKKEIKEGDKILDLGCNIGLFGKRIEKQKNCSLTGVEISQRMLARVTKDDYNDLFNLSIEEYLKIKNNELRNYNKQEAFFSLVVSFLSIGFIKDLTYIFSDVHNILKNDGYFAFICAVHIKDANSYKEIIYNNKFDIEDKLINFIIINKEIIDLHEQNFLIIIAKKYTK